MQRGRKKPITWIARSGALEADLRITVTPWQDVWQGEGMTVKVECVDEPDLCVEAQSFSQAYRDLEFIIETRRKIRDEHFKLRLKEAEELWKNQAHMAAFR